MKRWLLLSRFAVLNLTGIAGVVLLLLNNALMPLYINDVSRITVLITLFFIVGLVLSLKRAIRLSGYLNAVDDNKNAMASKINFLSKSESIESLKIKLYSGNIWISHISSALVMFGLIGTVLGAIMIFTNIDPSVAGDVSRVGDLFGIILNGMGTALNTTLVGSCLSLWLRFNYNILEQGNLVLISKLVDKNGYV